MKPHTENQEGAKAPVTRAEYNALLDRMEELEDTLVVLRAQEKGPSKDALPDSLMERMLDGEAPLRLWREHRGMTMQELHDKSGVGKSYISEIETGKKPGSVDALKKCAKALEIDLDDLVD